MHDGSLPTLEAVVAFYDQGGIDNENRSPLLAPLGLDAAEKAALVAFLKTLTGDNVEALARDARRASATLPVPTREPATVDPGGGLARILRYGTSAEDMLREVIKLLP